MDWRAGSLVASGASSISSELPRRMELRMMRWAMGLRISLRNDPVRQGEGGGGCGAGQATSRLWWIRGCRTAWAALLRLRPPSPRR